MTDSASPPVTLKARKAPRLTYKQEIQTIKNLPRTQRLIVIMKIAGVFLVAIGLEGIVTGQYLFTLVFVLLGVFVSMLPIRIKTAVFFFQAEDGIRDVAVTGVQTCALPI